MAYFNDAGSFLVNTLFGIYLVILILRFLFQYLRIDFYNPVSRFLVSATDPLLRPLRRFVPGYRGIDVASLILIVVIAMLEQSLLLMMHGISPNPLALPLLALAELLHLLLMVYMYSIIIHIIVSWVAPDSRSALVFIVYRISEPLLQPARNLIPPIGGLDLSPIAVLILLQLTSLLIVRPIRDFGYLMLGG